MQAFLHRGGFDAAPYECWLWYNQNPSGHSPGGAECVSLWD